MILLCDNYLPCSFHMIIIVYFQRYHMELAHNHPPPAKSGQVVWQLFAILVSSITILYIIDLPPISFVIIFAPCGQKFRQNKSVFVLSHGLKPVVVHIKSQRDYNHFPACWFAVSMFHFCWFKSYCVLLSFAVSHVFLLLHLFSAR